MGNSGSTSELNHEEVFRFFCIRILGLFDSAPFGIPECLFFAFSYIIHEHVIGLLGSLCFIEFVEQILCICHAKQIQDVVVPPYISKMNEME